MSAHGTTAESPDRHATGSLPVRVLAAYGAPAFSQSFLVGPAISVLQGIYAKYFGLGLEQVAVVLFVSRLFNAVSDPVIGHLSDRYRARYGSRKPWLVAGSVLGVVACWFLYVPAGGVTTLSFLCWFLLADIGWSMTEVPYGAWMAELSDDYGERTRLASWRAVGRYLGLLAFFGLPLALEPWLGSSEFTPETLRWAAILAAIALPTAAVVAALVVPDGAPAEAPVVHARRDVVAAVARNRPLWRVATTLAIAGLGNGMGWGLVFFYIDGYLGLGAQFSGLLVLSIPVAIVATPVWGALCLRFGKQQMWTAGYLMAATASLGYAFITPGPWAAAWLAVTLLMLNAVIVVEQVAGPAVIADVVDYGRWRLGADHGGTYFAAWAMITKGTIGLGAAISLAVAGALGFDATAGTQAPGGVLGLLVGMAVLPAACYLTAAVVIWHFPIDRRRQRVLVRALERRALRSNGPGVTGDAPASAEVGP